MAAQIRVYLTPEEAEHGTTRMVRPGGGHWVEVSIPPTRHDAVVPLSTERGEVWVRVTVVPGGISGSDIRGGRTGWRASVWLGIVALVGMLGLIVVLLVVRGCTTVHPLISPDSTGSSRFHGL